MKRANRRINDMKVKCDVQELNIQDKKQASIWQSDKPYLFNPMQQYTGSVSWVTLIQQGLPNFGIWASWWISYKTPYASSLKFAGELV